MPPLPRSAWMVAVLASPHSAWMHAQAVGDVWMVVADQAAESSSGRNDSQHNSTVGGDPLILVMASS